MLLLFLKPVNTTTEHASEAKFTMSCAPAIPLLSLKVFSVGCPCLYGSHGAHEAPVRVALEQG